MWTLSSSNSNSIDEVFSYFLESETYEKLQIRYRSETVGDIVPSLLDIVGMWLSTEDQCLVATSYDDLLIAVMGWIDDWIASDRKTVVGMPLWQVDGLALQIPQLVFAVEPSWENGRPPEHPVLSRVAFDAQQTLARNVRAVDTLEKLDELLEIMRSAPTSK